MLFIYLYRGDLYGRPAGICVVYFIFANLLCGGLCVS